MAAITEKFSITSKGEDIIDITSKVVEFTRSLDINNALLNIYVKSENSSLIISEYEVLKNSNIFSYLKSIVNTNGNINLSENDLKIIATLKSKLLSNTITMPIVNKQIEIDNYQKIFLIDFSHNISFLDVIISIVN